MNTTMLALLQITATLLLSVQHNPNISPAAQKEIISVASQAIQLSTQSLADIGFSVPQNNGASPNIADVLNAPYLSSANFGSDRRWVHLGQDVELISSSTSFGDLNGDGVDDAVVLVRRAAPDGSLAFSLAALLNQNGTLFNVGDTFLGDNVQMYSHTIQNGEFVADLQVDNEPRGVRHYGLLGNVFGETL